MKLRARYNRHRMPGISLYYLPSRIMIGCPPGGSGDALPVCYLPADFWRCHCYAVFFGCQQHPLHRFPPAVDRNAEDAPVNWQEHLSPQIQVCTDSFLRCHVNLSPVFIILSAFQQREGKGPVSFPDLLKALPISAVAAEKHPLLLAQDDPGGPQCRISPQSPTGKMPCRGSDKDQPPNPELLPPVETDNFLRR